MIKKSKKSMKRSSRKGHSKRKSYRRSRSKALRNSRTNQKGGLLYNSMVKRDIKEAINSAISSGKTSMFGAESVSGTMIKVELNTQVESPFISTSLNSMGNKINNILLKVVCIHPTSSSKIRYTDPNNQNNVIEKIPSTSDDFINEVAIQQDIYTKTNMLGESLCPAIIGAFILETNTNDYIVDSLKRIKVLNPLISTLQRNTNYRIGLIAMELLNGYNTLGNEVVVNDQYVSTSYNNKLLVSAYYAFIRLCTIGYRHNDLHFSNVMVNKNDTDYAGKYARSMIIDFGRTTRFGHKDRSMDLRFMKVIVNNPLMSNDVVYITQLLNDYRKSIKTDGYFSKGNLLEENFFIKHIGSVALNYIQNHIHDYQIERQKQIENHIRSGKYNHPKGVSIPINNIVYKIAPIQYKNTGNTLQSFNKLISNDSKDKIYFDTIFKSLNNKSGIDFDFTLILRTRIVNPKISDYTSSTTYQDIQSNEFLPSKLYDIIKKTAEYLEKENNEIYTSLKKIEQEKTKTEQEKIKAEQEKRKVELEKAIAEKEKDDVIQEVTRLKASLADIENKMDDATRNHIVNILNTLAKLLNTKGYGSYIQVLNDEVVRVATIYSTKYKNKIITDEIIEQMNSEILKELTETIKKSISSSVANEIIDDLNREFRTAIPKYEPTPQRVDIKSPILSRQYSNAMSD